MIRFAKIFFRSTTSLYCQKVIFRHSSSKTCTFARTQFGLGGGQIPGVRIQTDHGINTGFGDLIQELAVEAAVHGGREAALQAMLLDPVIDSIDTARKVLDELLAVHAPHLPQFR